MEIRLDKFLSSHGYCARRKVEHFLQMHQVKVNDALIVEPGFRFDPNKDRLLIDGQVWQQHELVYYIVNKPVGLVSSAQDDQGRKTVLDLLPEKITLKYRLYPVGRLDIDSQGLVLLTNDGDLAYRLTHPKFHLPKTYQLIIQGQVKDTTLARIRQGVPLKHYKTAPAEVERKSVDEEKTLLEITLYEGKNRQLRRMCKALNLELVSLKRVAIGSIELGNLSLGAYRKLTQAEITSLNSAE